MEEEVEDRYLADLQLTPLISNILTPSDTSTHGGFSVPKKHADECFPPLVGILIICRLFFYFLFKNLAYFWSLILQDMTQQTPAQEIVAKDLNGFEWHFRHIYRGKFRLFSFLSKISDSVATIY